jgi:transcriptional regulator with XRE-family HTH domain
MVKKLARRDLMFIFDYVVQRRKELGLSQKELAAVAGCSISVIKRFEANKPYNPNCRQIGRLAKALQVPANALLNCIWPMEIVWKPILRRSC